MLAKKRKTSKRDSKLHKKVKVFEPSSNLHSGLSKNTWFCIISFLPTKEILSVITTLNKYFYACTKESVRMLESIQVSLNLQRDLDSSKIVIFPQQALDYLAKAENISRLLLQIRIDDITPHLTRPNPLISILPMMTWNENLLTLEFTLLRYNYLVIRNFLSSLKSIQKLSLWFGWGFPIFIYDLILMFIDEKGILKKENVYVYHPLKTLKIVYLDQCIGVNHDVKLFEALDLNESLEEFHLDFQSKVPIISSCAPKLKSNKTLIKLKLPSAFCLNSETCKDFLNFLKLNEKLEHLEMTETIMSDFECFLEMIGENKTLKSLNLIPFIPDSGFFIGFKQIVQVIKSINGSNLKSFSLSTASFEVNTSEMPEINDENIDLFYRNLVMRSLQQIEEEFRENEKIERISLRFESLPQVFVDCFNIVTSDYLVENKGNLLVYEKAGSLDD